MNFAYLNFYLSAVFTATAKQQIAAPVWTAVHKTHGYLMRNSLGLYLSAVTAAVSVFPPVQKLRFNQSSKHSQGSGGI